MRSAPVPTGLPKAAGKAHEKARRVAAGLVGISIIGIGSLVVFGDADAGADRIARLAGRLVPVLLDLVEHVVDGDIELGATPAGVLGGVVDDLDVGVDAVALDAPGAVLLVEAEVGDGGVAPVDQARNARDADETAPGAGADELAELVVLEEPGEHVAARAGHAVDEHALGALVAVVGQAQSLPSRRAQ
jgi:uncharacterized membrane protein (Fun14 family)